MEAEVVLGGGDLLEPNGSATGGGGDFEGERTGGRSPQPDHGRGIVRGAEDRAERRQGALLGGSRLSQRSGSESDGASDEVTARERG
jgi:hypothetical protein